MDKVPGRPEQLVHESETQRQYVRVDIAARARVGNEEYPVNNISAGGIGIHDKEHFYRTGNTFEFFLIVPFQSFALDVPLKVEVEHYNKDTGLIGCRFIDMTKEKISIITHVLRGYIAGDLVTAGEIMNVVSRDNFSKARPAVNDDEDLSMRIRRFALLGGIGLLGLAALYIFSSNFYRSTFTVQSVRGVVESEMQDIKSPEAGIFQSTLKKGAATVEAGQEIGRIVPPLLNGGDTQNIVQVKSPCACSIVARVAGGERYVEAGEHIVTLVPLEAKPWISVVVELRQAQKISIGDSAEIKIAGSDIELTGTVARYETNIEDLKAGSSETGAVQAGVTTIIITPDQTLPLDLRGRPVTVTFKL
ncbi:MAG: PilZ domain-containing protein [Alphaproteobacteria bacterium]